MQHHEGAAQPRGLRRLRPEHPGPSSGETWRSILDDNSHFGTASASVQVPMLSVLGLSEISWQFRSW